MTWVYIWQTTSGASSHGNTTPLVDIKVVAVKYLFERPFKCEGNFLVNEHLLCSVYYILKLNIYLSTSRR